MADSSRPYSSRPYMLCESCNHIWVARTARSPSQCPRCGTTYVNVVTPESFQAQYECLSCHHEWEVWIATLGDVYSARTCPHCDGDMIIEDEDTTFRYISLKDGLDKDYLTFQPPGTDVAIGVLVEI